MSSPLKLAGTLPADEWMPRRRSAVPPRWRRLEYATRVATVLLCAAILGALLIVG